MQLFELALIKKKLVEYDKGHYLDPEKYNKEILEWLKENL
jgi:predicted transcriptional regulator